MIGGISQKMLTQTLRDLERDGLVKRTIDPEIPPHVELRSYASWTHAMRPTWVACTVGARSH
jgi:DNA-binding HxlR family transcriptional regulator